MNSLKGIKNLYCIVTACLVAVGLLFLIYPKIALDSACIIFGVYLVIYGVIKLIGYFAKDRYQLAFQYDLACGIVSIIVGIIFICRAARVIQLFSTCIGIVMLVDATLKIQTSIESKRFGISNWWLILIAAAIVAVLGVVLIFMPYETTALMIRLIGFNLCFDGLLNLIVVINTVK